MDIGVERRFVFWFKLQEHCVEDELILEMIAFIWYYHFTMCRISVLNNSIVNIMATFGVQYTLMKGMAIWNYLLTI